MSAGTRGRKVWILGDSLVRRAGEYATSRGKRDLGTERDTQVRWFGRGGLELHNIPRSLQDLLRHHATPNLIILHVGSNNIGKHPVKLCRQAVEEVLLSTRQLLPESHVCYSEIIPRLFYYGRGEGPHSQPALDKCRKNINRYAKSRIKRMFRASYLQHRFHSQDHELFHRDGVHLSDRGNELLIGDFEMTLRELFF